MACIDSGSKLVMRITDHLSEMCSSQKHIQAHQSIRRVSLALPREQLLSGQFVRIAFFFFFPLFLLMAEFPELTHELVVPLVARRIHT